MSALRRHKTRSTNMWRAGLQVVKRLKMTCKDCTVSCFETKDFFSPVVSIPMRVFLPANISSLRCPAVVHGQGEGWGAVAEQTDLAATGKVDGKSSDVKTTRRYFCSPGQFQSRSFCRVTISVIFCLVLECRGIFFLIYTNFSHLLYKAVRETICIRMNE